MVEARDFTLELKLRDLSLELELGISLCRVGARDLSLGLKLGISR